MAIHVTPIPSTISLVTPAYTLGTANTAGAASTAVASDSTLLVFSTTVPTSITNETVAAAPGDNVLASREDHVHGTRPGYFWKAVL